MSNKEDRLDALQEKIANLENLRDVLGEDVVNQKQADLQAEIDTLIQTEGGDVVGRDKKIIKDPVRFLEK